MNESKKNQETIPFMPQGISESRFYMWRTLFAITHVDHNVSKEEVRFMAEALEDVPFSEEQRKILRDDSIEARDVMELFKRVSDPKDQAEFFNFARTLVWADGQYGEAERDILLKLKTLHISTVKVDDLVNKVELEFAPEENYAEPRIPRKKKGFRAVLDELIEQFREEKDITDGRF